MPGTVLYIQSGDTHKGRRDLVDAWRLDVQALYTVQALASIGNVSTRLLRRVLRANGVAFVRGGRALFVPLAEIQRKIPPLWESLHLVAQVQGRVLCSNGTSGPS